MVSGNCRYRTSVRGDTHGPAQGADHLEPRDDRPVGRTHDAPQEGEYVTELIRQAARFEHTPALALLRRVVADFGLILREAARDVRPSPDPRPAESSRWQYLRTGPT